MLSDGMWDLDDDKKLLSANPEDVKAVKAKYGVAGCALYTHTPRTQTHTHAHTHAHTHTHTHTHTTHHTFLILLLPLQLTFHVFWSGLIVLFVQL